MPRNGRFLFSFVDGRVEDAALHNEILSEGYEDVANEIGVAVMKRLGLSDGEIATLMHTDLQKEFDESKHPRDEHGRFSESGGGDEGGGESDHPGHGYSKDAHVDANGVIHTSNVYDATRALYEGREVELKQPRQVSTLVKHLGEVTKHMVEMGKDAPNFDLCKVTVKGTNLFCADSEGIPRAKMPQLDDEQTKAFRHYLEDKGYKIEKTKEDADHIRATQNQLIGAKVAKIAEKLRKDPESFDKRLIISRDNYLLDGHHHWAAKIAIDAKDNKLGDEKIKVSRVDADIITLLKEAEKFTGGKGHKGTDERAWDESEHPREPAGSPEGGQFTGGGGGGGGGDGDKESTGPKPPSVADVPAYAGQRHDDTHEGKKIYDKRADPSYLTKSKHLDGVEKLTTVLWEPHGSNKYLERVWAIPGADGEPKSAIMVDSAGRVNKSEIEGITALRYTKDPHQETITISKPTDHAAKAAEIVASVPGAAEKMAEAKALLAKSVPTDAPVTKGGYKTATGHWLPSRERLHSDIIASEILTKEKINAARPPAGEKPVVHILGGIGGSGKGWFVGPKGTVDKSKAIYINSDDVKDKLPEFEGWNAALLHDESSYVGKLAERYAREKHLNIILDGTMAKSDQLIARIVAYRKAGYRIEGHFMKVKPETAAKRAVGRYMQGSREDRHGRLVSPEMILAAKAYESFLRAQPLLDAYEVFDNEGDAPKLISRG